MEGAGGLHESGVWGADRGGVRAVGGGAVAGAVEGGVWVAGGAGECSARLAGAVGGLGGAALRPTRGPEVLE